MKISNEDYMDSEYQKDEGPPKAESTLYKERFRPQFHFSPKKNWMNDPNGLVYYQGRYHCYFQYNPSGDQWGNIQWGHATSVDGIHWKEEQVALKDETCMAFSGTTAILPKDYPAIGGTKGDLLAAYTSFEHHYPEGELMTIAQHQSLALSKDGGMSFAPLEQNPVLDIRSTEFRDPKIFYQPERDRWMMLVVYADLHQVGFFTSTDLIDWQEVSRFGPAGNIDCVWECPDLFYLPLEDSETGKWVLTVSAGHPQKGFLGMQYFIGEFDGDRFNADEAKLPHYLDYGKDFYAGICFVHNPKEEGVLMMGWIGNHLYSRLTPTSPWRGALSVPRRLKLKVLNNRVQLCSEPHYSGIASLVNSTLWNKQTIRLNNGALDPGIRGKCLFISIDFERKGAEECGLKLLKNKEHSTTVGLHFGDQELFVDRRNSGSIEIHKDFASRDTCLLPYTKGIHRLEILLDNSVLEVFYNRGERVFTHLVFGPEEADGIRIYAKKGEILIHQAQIQQLSKIWSS